MKFHSYQLATLMLIVGLQFANGESPRQTGDDLRALSQSSEELREKNLRTLLESTDLARVSVLFAESNKIDISRGRSGQLRIFVGDVSVELLATRIHRITLTPIERYNAADAIIAITQAKEIQSKLRRLNVQQPPGASPGLRQKADRRVRHLPASMKNLTLEEALDQVAETFGYPVIYAEWTEDGARWFDVSYAHGEAFEGLGRKELKVENATSKGK